ncbi:hypothetical protein F503_07972 [Ophiostoma piceae UAMH 11346]|uniref:S-adenosylmethionine-dependent methyltransferase-like protein n=1 Tax=Ophiostoma piceae (strain UAMH 11346) TaxID=1262450 RepID=S3C621_OPHP1|nr:hypothetical protein F503_07972 [Ophiostoma piceae UAMH 11346]
MPSFLSGRQGSRSHHHQQQQQQQQDQQQQPSSTLQQQAPPQQSHPYGDPSSSSGASAVQDSGSASASTYSNADLQPFDTPQTQLQRQQGQQGLDDQQFSSQQQRIQQQQFQSASGGPGLAKSSSTKLPSSVASSGGNGPSPGFDNRFPHLASKRSDLDYQDQVSRSQSQRYATQGQPQQSHQHYASSSLGAASVDDLSRIQLSSPLESQEQRLSVAQPQPTPAPAQPPVQEKTRATRKLFKNFLGGGSSSSRAAAAAAAAAASDSSSRSNQQQTPPPPPASQNAHNNTAGIGRHPSKRLSQQQPPALRTGHSQVSVLESSSEWPIHTQQQQYVGADGGKLPPNTQPSPLQGIGEFSSNAPAGYPSDNDQPPPPIRRVRTVDLDQESSPYGAENIARLSNSHLGQNPQQGAYLQHLQASSPTTYSQGRFDPSQQQQHQQQYPALQYQQQPHAVSTNSPHHAFIGHLGTTGLQQQQFNHLHQQQQNPETLSQVSHESPVADADQLASSSAGSTFLPQDQQLRALQQDQGSTTPPLLQHLQQNQGQPQAGLGQQQQQQILQPPSQAQGHDFQDLNQQLQEQDQQQNMAGGPPPSRRSQDASEKSGPPPSYRHSQTTPVVTGSTGNLSPLPPLPQNSGGNAAGSNPSQYRPTDQRQYEAIVEGRNSPQPPAGDQAPTQETEKQLKDLAVKYKNVKRLYFEGKGTIDLLNAQIEHLQNAIANQRMSQSRTVLDDSEYVTRFNRLNGAINDLSFNIRKDWKDLPLWIEPYTSKDALRTGKQEMTAAGRAIISMWVMEHIFNNCFHPGLDTELSSHLKRIEQNIRLTSHKMNSQEEHDTLTSKIVNWRMTTLDGLQSTLNSHESSDNRAKLISVLVGDLTGFLHSLFKDPRPPGVEGSASMIVELAVGIVGNLPMESRDVAISFPMPHEHIMPHLMEVDKSGLPSLETRPADDGGEPDVGEGDPDVDEQGRRSAHPSNDMPLVRFAAFFAVEVRGRQVLSKAPVYTL